ncbi:hypothetical protein ASG06_11070 [Rathayibacter sp. Leaf185]|nr:hypothetical protein ASF42_11070 [Rathayibacter sp. Leaf294]KQS12432.1 hypothetical protein ASG06_11070 [Rathayibacter sp. Leaf185]
MAGLFLVWAPAAREAGWWLLVGLGIAVVAAGLGVVADAGREVQDGPTGAWLRLAGRALASAAIALTAAESVLGASARPVAILLLVAVTLFVVRGGVLRPRLAVTLGALVGLLLAAAVVIVLLAPPVVRSSDLILGGPEGAVTAAAYLLLLVVPAAQQATSTRRSLLRLAVAALVAAAVGTGLLLLVGPEALAASATPLRALAEGTAATVPVAIAAVLASLVALVVLARRDGSALVRLADEGEIPGPFARRNRRTGVPSALQLVVCLVSVLAVVILDADALLAFAVGAGLVASILRRLDRGVAGARWPAVVSAALALILLLALPSATAAAVAIVLAGLLIVRSFRR